MNSVRVSINGKTFPLSTEDNPERIKNLAMELNSKISQFMKDSGVNCQDATSLVAFMLMDDIDNANTTNRELKSELSKQKKDFEESEHQLISEYSDRMTRLNAQYSRQVATLKANQEKELKTLREEFGNLAISPEEVRALKGKIVELEEKARLELLEIVSLEYNN